MYESGNDGEVDWREALQGLHTDLTLSEGTPWERIGEAKLVDELQQMTMGNHIARSKERDVHYAVRVATRARTSARPAFWSRPLRPKSPIYGMPRRCCGGSARSNGSVEDPDPFFDAPDHRLIGVGFCALQSLIYLMDIAETCNIISFQGQGGGHVISYGETHTRGLRQLIGEKNLAYHLEKKVELNITITQAMKLPQKLCASVYVRTAFFLQQDS